jgi:DNA-binding FadR family transcriptional regulator
MSTSADRDETPRFIRDRTRRTAKASEQVARDLTDYIVENDLQAGTRLPNERDMLEATGVGRTTLREAMRLLESRGLISIRAGRSGGPVVRRPQAADLAESLGVMLRYENASLSEVIDARCALEPAVARIAAGRVTPAQLGELEANLDRTAAARSDHRAFFAESQAFHSVLALAADNVVLRIFVETIQSIIDNTTSTIRYSDARRETILDDHRNILAALSSGEPDAAAKAMAGHLSESDSFWRRRYAHLLSGPIRSVGP